MEYRNFSIATSTLFCCSINLVRGQGLRSAFYFLYYKKTFKDSTSLQIPPQKSLEIIYSWSTSKSSFDYIFCISEMHNLLDANSCGFSPDQTPIYQRFTAETEKTATLQYLNNWIKFLRARIQNDANYECKKRQLEQSHKSFKISIIVINSAIKQFPK